MAAPCPPYGCVDDWDDIDAISLCPQPFNGGMSAMIIFKCDVTRKDITDDDDQDLIDADKIEDLITNNRAKKILGPGVRITLNAPEAVTQESFDPCGTEQTVNYNRSLLLEDANVTLDRTRFYNSINTVTGFVIGSALILECDANRFTYIDGEIKFAGGRQSPTPNTERQFFSFDVTWRSKEDPDPLPFVSGVF